MDTIGFIAVCFIIFPSILFYKYKLIQAIYILFWSTRENWSKMGFFEWHWKVLIMGLIAPLMGMLGLYALLYNISIGFFNYFF
jgi:hypothetical protein|tara:strand:+ start:154 stop:402 length:249 start_codon:yes stop_codon:yes gene_type:complete